MATKKRKLSAQDELQKMPPPFKGENGRISIPAARKMLGMIGRNYSDEQVAEILDGLYAIAEMSWERWRAEERPDGPATMP